MVKPLQSRTEKLISVIQQLSLCKTFEEIRDIVKYAARELVNSDGATFVMRDNDQCYYVDEYAIAPLWKGKKFPLSACISGWAMLNKQSVMIEDIYQDDRIPQDAYRPTFVKSLLMVPIRKIDPIGAIGNYWQAHHHSTLDEIQLLEALANSTSIAIENVTVYMELEKRVKERTAQLYAVNQELEAFSYSVSHDLKAPLRAIDNFSAMLLEDKNIKRNEHSKHIFERIKINISRMYELIDDLLTLSKISRSELYIENIDLKFLAENILKELAKNNPNRSVNWIIQDNLMVNADKQLIKIVLENLISNSWKFTSKVLNSHIQIGRIDKDNETVFFVRDNGAGFDPQYTKELFRPFKRLHSEADFPGTGIGLATVQRIIQLHSGKIWAESNIGNGAVFYFILGSG